MDTPTRQDNHMVLCQQWLESESGWGHRPDGYSLHLTRDDHKAFVASYWATMPDATPDEYSRPDGAPYWADVDAATHAEVATGANGIRRYRGAPPQEK